MYYDFQHYGSDAFYGNIYIDNVIYNYIDGRYLSMISMYMLSDF